MKNLAHLRHPAAGRTIWAGARWITPGPSRTVQFHDLPQHVFSSEVSRKTQEGTSVSPAHYDVPPAVPVQMPLMGSYFLSDPRVFQSYFKVHWEDMHGARANLAEGTRRMTPLPNPNARGRAEGQALIPYHPYPSATELYPAYPTGALEGKVI